MKTLVTTLLILSLSVCAQAADFSTINQESLNAFFKIMPQYSKIMNNYQQDVGDLGDIAAIELTKGSGTYKDITELFGKYKTTPEEFVAFFQKITMAFASAQMEGMEIPPMPFGMGNFSGISEEEMAIVKENLEEVEQAFDAE